MSGLFERASEFAPQSPDGSSGAAGPSGPSEEILFDEESGMSKEDQKDILAEIDRVVEDNRIAVTPDTLKIHAQKRGTLFPLLVNLLSVVLLVGGGFGLYLLFQRGESGLREEVHALASAEGKLIEELKKESEARLLEKNREIAGIQNRLAEIDQERQDLQANMDARVAAREEELRRALEAELAAERERLREQGISEIDITRRIDELEARKTEAYQGELAAFRRQAEEERRQAEANLAALRDEFETSLAQANQERSRVLEESQAREAELRRQLDAQTQALERETQSARQELTRIEEQRDREQLAAGQLAGFYDRVRDDLEGERFEEALGNLNAIRDYLNDPQVATLPSMLERREIEFFVVDSITSLVRGEMVKEEVDTSSLVAAANVVTDLKNRILQADELYASGQVEQAEALYREALALIPEVDRAHEALLNRNREGELGRAGQLRDFLKLAEAAYAAGDFEATLDNYTRALEYLPEEQPAAQRFVSQIREAGFQLGLRGLRRDQSAAAADALARTDRLLSSGQHVAAMTGYVELIRRYPHSEQVGAAVEGINRAAEARGLLAGGDVARLQKELEARDARIEALESELEQKTAEVAALEAELESKTARLAVLEMEGEGGTGSIIDLQAELAIKEDEVAALQAELERSRGRTAEDEARFTEQLGKLQEQLDGKVAVIGALEEEKTAMQREMTALRQEIAALQARAGGVVEAGEASELREQLQEMLAQVSAAEARAEGAEAEVQETRAQAEQARSQAQEARTEAEAAEARSRELAAKVQRLEALEARYNRLVEGYQDYVSKETSLLAGRGSAALAETKVHLNAFLAANEETFPGLWVRIKRYDEAYETAGRRGAAQEISQILYELSLLNDPGERAAYLERETARYPEDPIMLELLEELKELPVGGSS
ncbi:MAG: hypothetical protein JW820_09660 [Spirochaetales bacterium]|nr:hypothetical protein [Spirochaetales bacterium]